ncbi:MAG: glutamate decarboxylase [Nitrospirae bacterium]|nr:glutamate decarboxylase [Nitrospirota bacterium]
MLTRRRHRQTRDDSLSTTYGNRFFTKDLETFRIGEESLPPASVYQIIHDELELDGNPSLNLASFVTTWMEPEAERLVRENIRKNLVDQNEYPRTGEIQHRVVHMLADLFHAPPEADIAGTSTVGSSEAILLGLLAHKKSWQIRRRSAGKPADRPNLVVGGDVHVVWDKFARYFDVEMRTVPLSPGRFTLSVDEAVRRIDENTIAVGAVVGTTFTGQIDPVEELNEAVEKLKREKGWDIPIHIDGASGGLILPFLEPERRWDFRLSRVRSINVSGHKFGLVYPGVGWLVFRDRSDLPDDLVFRVDYLGAEEETYTLNFSSNAAFVIAQYYNFLRLGKKGYRSVMENARANARHLAKKLSVHRMFEPVDEKPALPIVAFRLRGPHAGRESEIASELRKYGWIVPAYTLPPDAENTTLLRVVVRENVSRQMLDDLLEHLDRSLDVLENPPVKRKPHPPLC